MPVAQRSKPFGFLATVALGMSGCLAAPAPASEPPPFSPAPVFAFSLPVDVPSSDGGESFVAVSRDGQTILTCNHGEFSAPSPAFVSEDGGTSFRAISIDPSPVAGGDCETAAMEDGTWVFLSSTVAGATVSSSTDRGKTWLTNPLSAAPTNGMCDRPWLEGVGKDLALSCMPLFAQPGYVGVQVSSDKGRSWTQPKHVTTWDGRRTTNIHGNLQVFPDGAIFLPTYKYPQPVSDTGVPTPDAVLGFAISEDHGRTWRELKVMDPVNTLLFPPTAAAAGTDRLYYPYSTPNGTWTPGPLPQGRTDVRVVVSEDRGKTWSDPVQVASGLTAFGIPWADGSPDGTAMMLLQVLPREVGLEGDEPAVVAFRLDAEAPGMVRSKAVVGQGGAEFVTADHDAQGRAYVSFGRDGITRMAVELVGQLD